MLPLLCCINNNSTAIQYTTYSIKFIYTFYHLVAFGKIGIINDKYICNSKSYDQLINLDPYFLYIFYRKDICIYIGENK